MILAGATAVALASSAAGCAGARMDFFGAPEPGWEPRAMDRVAVVVLGESREGRERIAGGVVRGARERGAEYVALEDLLGGFSPDTLAARLDSAGSPERDTARAHRYGRLAGTAFGEAGMEAVLEISLEAGGRIVDPGIEHTVYDCDQWVETRTGLVCLRPRSVTFRGDTLFRPWGSYDVRLRDPRTDRILWRGGAHTMETGYRRPAEMHRDLVEALVEELVEDGILRTAREEP